MIIPLRVLMAMLVLLVSAPAVPAHHTLGINQTGKATDSPQIPVDREILAGDLLFQVTVLPAHPEPREIARVIVHAVQAASGAPFPGEMRFRIARKFWFWSGKPLLDSRRLPIDGRHVQNFEFPEAGDHVVRLGVVAQGRPSFAEFSITVGHPLRWWKLLAGLLAAAAVAGVTWKAFRNRKRLRPV